MIDIFAWALYVSFVLFPAAGLVAFLGLLALERYWASFNMRSMRLFIQIQADRYAQDVMMRERAEQQLRELGMLEPGESMTSLDPDRRRQIAELADKDRAAEVLAEWGEKLEHEVRTSHQADTDAAHMADARRDALQQADPARIARLVRTMMRGDKSTKTGGA
ncbi:MAG: hypothetical protein HY722_12200 [Planctomycetes bacterium]|nr:hypothetical protein [Planctomycetota bacterium]